MNKTNQFLRRGENVARKPGFRSGFGPSGRVGRAVLEVATAAGVKVRFRPTEPFAVVTRYVRSTSIRDAASAQKQSFD